MSSRVRTSTKKGNKLYVDKDSKTNIKKKKLTHTTVIYLKILIRSV